MCTIDANWILHEYFYVLFGGGGVNTQNTPLVTALVHNLSVKMEECIVKRRQCDGMETCTAVEHSCMLT